MFNILFCTTSRKKIIHSTHSLTGCEKSKSGELNFVLYIVEKTNVQVIIKII